MSALVFVTGGSSGIGAALLRTCPWPRPRRLAFSRRAAADCEAWIEADLATPNGWERAARCFEAELAAFAGGRVALLQAAGTLEPIGFAGEVDAEAYRRNLLLNAVAPAVLGDAFLRALHRSKAELIADLVIVSSGAARNVYEGWSGYAAGKAAVDQWVRTVGAEQARRGGRCRVLAVAPGVVETPMQEAIRSTPEDRFPQVGRFVELHERGLLRRPEEAARDLWALLEEKVGSGAVIDLRERGPAAG